MNTSNEVLVDTFARAVGVIGKYSGLPQIEGGANSASSGINDLAREPKVKALAGSRVGVKADTIIQGASIDVSVSANDLAATPPRLNCIPSACGVLGR